MDFKVNRGEMFSEEFNFKNPAGQSRSVPPGAYRVVLEHDTFVREYTVGQGLRPLRTKLTWTITPEETKDFEYNKMYYTLYLDDNELARGILRVQ
jgi:hypothetical protein